MSNKLKYYDLTDILLLVLLYVNNEEPIKGRLWLQKIMFVLDRNIDEIKAAFEGSYIGPNSIKVEVSLEQFVSSNYIIAKRSGKISLSPKGKMLAEEAVKNISTERLNLIKEIKKFLNDMNRKELIAFIYSSFPNYIVESQILDEFEENRYEASISLYKKGKVSLSKAAEIAGYPLSIYIEKIRR
ncbi:MAG: hypothetical protein ACTSR3_20410 [Candidatus Helarchaeota archaeon]